MKINLTQRLQDIDGSDRFAEPEYNAELLFQNIMAEVARIWGKEAADKLVDSLNKKQLVPEKATIKNMYLLALKKDRNESMDAALKNYKMLDRIRKAEAEIDLGLEECEGLLEKVHKTFKDTLVTGQIKELTVDRFIEADEPTPEPEPEPSREPE